MISAEQIKDKFRNKVCDKCGEELSTRISFLGMRSVSGKTEYWFECSCGKRIINRRVKISPTISNNYWPGY